MPGPRRDLVRRPMPGEAAVAGARRRMMVRLGL
jgi:hypothetical protein